MVRDLRILRGGLSGSSGSSGALHWMPSPRTTSGDSAEAEPSTFIVESLCTASFSGRLNDINDELPLARKEAKLYE